MKNLEEILSFWVINMINYKPVVEIKNMYLKTMKSKRKKDKEFLCQMS